MTLLDFSPDGRTIATAGVNGEVKLWNLATGREMLTFKAHSTAINELKFAPDGRMLMSNGDPIARAWFAPDLSQTDLASGVSGETR